MSDHFTTLQSKRLIEKELIHQLHLRKYLYTKLSFLLYLTKKKDQNIVQLYKPSLLKLLKKLSLIAAGFYIFYHFCSDCDQIFKNKNRCKNFIVIVTSNKVASMKALNIW